MPNKYQVRVLMSNLKTSAKYTLIRVSSGLNLFARSTSCINFLLPSSLLKILLLYGAMSRKDLFEIWQSTKHQCTAEVDSLPQSTSCINFVCCLLCYSKYSCSMAQCRENSCLKDDKALRTNALLKCILFHTALANELGVNKYPDKVKLTSCFLAFDLLPNIKKTHTQKNKHHKRHKQKRNVKK